MGRSHEFWVKNYTEHEEVRSASNSNHVADFSFSLLSQHRETDHRIYHCVGCMCQNSNIRLISSCSVLAAPIIRKFVLGAHASEFTSNMTFINTKECSAKQNLLQSMMIPDIEACTQAVQHNSLWISLAPLCAALLHFAVLHLQIYHVRPYTSAYSVTY